MRLRLRGPKRSGQRPPGAGGERGFTLAETAVALLILMVAGLGAASLFTFGIKNNAGTKDRDLALAVAQKRMEWVRSIPFNPTNRGLAFRYPTAANPTGGGLAATAGVTETEVNANRTYSVTTVISNDGGVADASALSKTITVTVTPAGTSAVIGRVTLVTRRTTLATGNN